MNNKERIEYARAKLRNNHICQIYDRLSKETKHCYFCNRVIKEHEEYIKDSDRFMCYTCWHDGCVL